MAMHVLIVNLNLKDTTVDQRVDKEAARIAPAFAQLLGLLSKMWFADTGTNTYGGI